jgi:amidophosphoribosyltransferase
LDEAQPLKAAGLDSLTLVHVRRYSAEIFLCNKNVDVSEQNGHLLNANQLCDQLEDDLYPVITSNSDSEALLGILALSLRRSRNGKFTAAESIFAALDSVYKHCIGSFACVVMLADDGIFAFRDANGIKPLVWGKRKTNNGTFDHMCASESVALERLGFEDIADVAPGK